MFSANSTVIYPGHAHPSVSGDRASGRSDHSTRKGPIPAALALVACALLLLARTVGGDSQVWLVLAILVAPLAIAVFSFKERPIRFALGLGVFFVTLGWYSSWERGSPLHVSRNFFGVKRVVEGSDGKLRKLIHGTTFHGIQFIDPARSREPLAYYHRTGPLGDVFSAFPGRGIGPHVGIIGLGAGAIASYAEPDQTFTFYEIDPVIERIARDASYFTFLSQCRGAYEVILGDGRLTLANVPDHHYDMLVLDAFSSDAIPTHLLTSEALQLYLDKLTKDGLLVFHISNRFLNLELLLGNLASKAGLVGRARKDWRIDKDDPKTAGKLGSHYVVLARNPEHLGELANAQQWGPLQVDERTPVWTDQYTSVFSYLFKR